MLYIIIRDYNLQFDSSVNSRAALKDLKKGSQLTVLVDRSQGGASLKNGEVF